MIPMEPWRVDWQNGRSDNMVMKYVALIVLFGVMCPAAEQAPKPACNAKNHGLFWPEEVNSSHDAERLLFQSGELEMCSLVVWKYKWEHLSVNARDVAEETHPFASKPGKAAAKQNN
jgi:hypothetical protein